MKKAHCRIPYYFSASQHFGTARRAGIATFEGAGTRSWRGCRNRKFRIAGFLGVAVSFVYHKSHQSVDNLPLTSSKLLENETLRNILTELRAGSKLLAISPKR